MARIPEDEIDRLKREISLRRLVEASGVALKKHGKDYLGLCPFHDDREPSLVISPEANLWHCLGACQAGGSVIDWVMKAEGVSFRHAVELLRADDRPLAASGSPPAKRTRAVKLDRPFGPDGDDQALLNQVIAFYHETLRQSPEALSYLEKRGLGDPALIERFKLGFANRTLGYRLPEKTRKAGAALRGALQRLGILRASGHEHFAGSLVVPVSDGAGNVSEVYGRKITTNLRKGTPLHLYLPGPHRGVWNAESLAGQREVVLCEALLDALSFYHAGYRNVTASYGVEGFTEAHLRAFAAAGIARVLIAYDGDVAGDRAAAKLAARLRAQGLACYRVVFPKGMDANAYALSVQPAAKSLGVAIRAAQPMDGETAPQRRVAAGRDRPAGRQSPAPSSSLAADPEGSEAEVSEDPAASLAAAERSEAPPPEPEASTAPDAPDTPPAPPLPAAALAPAPEAAGAPEVAAHEVSLHFGARGYRVRGLAKNTSYEVMKVNLLVRCGDEVHVDSFDLYSAKHRQAFARTAAAALEVEAAAVQRDLGRLLLELEGLQDQAIQRAMQPAAPAAHAMDAADRERALALLRDPGLATRIQRDFETVGLVGEPTNALIGYLAAVSRKLATPLAIIVQSTSAAGKSALMEAVLRLAPEEDRVHYSAMTGQSLFYLGERDLRHKVLAIAEEEGVRQAAYALKLLQSQGALTIASTGKDPQSGKLITEEYRVEGPVMLFLTTAAIDIDEELLNRCLVLAIDESREQTAAIQRRQRAAATLPGLLAGQEAGAVVAVHRNAQRLLKPVAVVNPYAEQLGFLDERTRTRRDHQKYLTLIEAVALLHQHQREVKRIERAGQAIEYIEVTRDDIALANRLAHEALGRSLDELPPQTRRLLGGIDTLVRAQMAAEGLRREEVRLTRRTIREASGLSDTRLRSHLERLVGLEYLTAHRGRQGARYLYELVFDGDMTSDAACLPGLVDPKTLPTTPTSPTPEATSPTGSTNFAPTSPPPHPPFAGGSPPGITPENPSDHGALRGSEAEPPANAPSGSFENTPS